MNPFKNPAMRKAYALTRDAYREKHPDLFTANGGKNTMNGPGMMFWRGYDGTYPAAKWDRASRGTIAYARWCAGRDVKREAE